LKKENENINQEIKQLKEENEGLKEFAIKIKDKDEKITEENINYKEKISILQKENNEYKQYFKDKKNNSEKNGENYINIISELNEAKKEIKNVKKKNEELFNELESAKFVNHYHDNHSEGKALSNYEEEFDLKKMAKGAMDKNRSQDINIDYPGAQRVKEKYRELDFYYGYLEELVRKLLLNSTCTNKNRTYISELCKIVGFDDDACNIILNNKSKKGLLSMFGY
jgi:chromosome segregation ATPase